MIQRYLAEKYADTSQTIRSLQLSNLQREPATAKRRMLPRLLYGALIVHGFAPPVPQVAQRARRAVARHFDAASAAADILADPTARFEAATVVLLASFASAASAEVKISLHAIDAIVST